MMTCLKIAPFVLGGSVHTPLNPTLVAFRRQAAARKTGFTVQLVFQVKRVITCLEA